MEHGGRECKFKILKSDISPLSVRSKKFISENISVISRKLCGIITNFMAGLLNFGNETPTARITVFLCLKRQM